MEIISISDIFIVDRENLKAVGFTVAYSNGRFINEVEFYDDNNQDNAFSVIIEKHNEILDVMGEAHPL